MALDTLETNYEVDFLSVTLTVLNLQWFHKIFEWISQLLVGFMAVQTKKDPCKNCN